MSSSEQTTSCKPMRRLTFSGRQPLRKASRYSLPCTRRSISFVGRCSGWITCSAGCIHMLHVRKNARCPCAVAATHNSALRCADGLGGDRTQCYLLCKRWRRGRLKDAHLCALHQPLL